MFKEKFIYISIIIKYKIVTSTNNILQITPTPLIERSTIMDTTTSYTMPLVLLMHIKKKIA